VGGGHFDLKEPSSLSMCIVNLASFLENADICSRYKVSRTVVRQGLRTLM